MHKTRRKQVIYNVDDWEPNSETNPYILSDNEDDVILLPEKPPPKQNSRLNIPSTTSPSIGRKRKPAESSPRPAKRQRVESPSKRVPAQASTSRVRNSDIIEISSDSESESDEEYAWWPEHRYQDEPGDPPPDPVAPPQPFERGSPTIRFNRRPPRLRPTLPSPSQSGERYIWDFLQKQYSTHSLPLQEFNRLHLTSPSRLAHDRGRSTYSASVLRETDSFQCPGGITKIAQYSKYIVAGSGTPGGGPDDDQDRLDPYNKEGTLRLYSTLYDQSERNLKGHVKRRQSPPYEKSFTINDVVFYPSLDNGDVLFASSGNDKFVKTRESRANQTKSLLVGDIGRVPNALALQPEKSVLAIGERDITLLHEPDPDSGTTPLKMRAPRSTVGEIVWGKSATKEYLFASTEPINSNKPYGLHKAFEVATQHSYQFDADESGDSIGIHPDGTELALVTEADGTAFLRLYDITRKDSRHKQKIQLRPFQADSLITSTSSASYSPDGIYLALGRSDNRSHVYDSRMLSRGVLYDFVHTGASKVTPGDNAQGNGAQVGWILTRSSRLRLVSGGEDGCVRLWNPLVAADSQFNGQIVAETNADIGRFSIGDPYNGENELVVGDGDGWVRIYNAKRPFFLTCDG